MSPGTGVIKHYQIVTCLGEGGFGKVFEAWDSKLQRSVAIKCLKTDGLLSSSADLMREARMAASLNHPAFVKIHALEDDDNSQAIVMELVKGETLKHVVTNKKVDLSQALNIVHQIAEAMQQAHTIGLTHGDLKPSNVMLEPTGAIRILDFGLASKADNQATTSMLQQDPQGTIAYMAPERLLGAPLAPSIDVYALGVIFYELLNGHRPFADLSGLALAAALVQSSSDQWNYSAELSTSLIHLIRCMTAKQSAQRLSSMAEVLDQLDVFKNGTLLENNSAHPEIHIPPKAKNKLPKQLRNKHLKNAVLLSFIVIGCVVLGGWLTRNFLWRFEEVIPRYSESQEMKMGMGALEQWDRPGSLDQATQHFNNLIGKNSKNAAAIAGLSITYSLRYQSDEQDNIWLQKADVAAQQALSLNDQLALSQVATGMVLDLQGNSEAALQTLSQAIDLNSINKIAWYAKFEALKSMGQFKEAKKFLESGIVRFPKERLFVDALGEIYYIQGDYAAAEKAFRHSIKLEPDAVISYANLNAILLHQNRIDEALQVIQQGLEVRPGFNLYTNLGNTLFISGNHIAAAKAFESALAPNKGNPNSYIGWANFADTLLWIPGRTEEARNAYQRAKELLAPRLARTKDDVTLMSRMGLYSARTGDRTTAINYSVQAMDLAPDNPNVYFRAGLAFELLGDRPRALAEIEKAKSLGYPINLIEAEPDLVALRRDASYR
jgi:eukaryotic-like serine/threonine-protein kinase